MSEINLHRRRLLAGGLGSAFMGLWATSGPVSAVTRWAPGVPMRFDYVELAVPGCGFDSLAGSLLPQLDDSCGSALGSMIFDHGVVADRSRSAAKPSDRFSPANARTTDLGALLRACAHDLVTSPTPRTTILGLRHASASEARYGMQPDGNGLSNLSFSQDRQLRERLTGRSATFVLMTNGGPRDRMLCRIPCRSSDLPGLFDIWREQSRGTRQGAGLRSSPGSGHGRQRPVRQASGTQARAGSAVAVSPTLERHAHGKNLTIRNTTTLTLPVSLGQPDLPNRYRRYILAPTSSIQDTLPSTWHRSHLYMRPAFQAI